MLEYFTTKRQLIARQARWAETLSRFNFKIIYRPGKQNTKADALTRRRQDTEEQGKQTTRTRTQTLLKPERLDEQIQQELLVAPLDTQSLDLMDRILTANRTSESLTEGCEKAAHKETEWELQNGLLRYRDKLVVPADDNL